ncbi:hypothetical protein KR067_010046 [Drosophila pandora]|nr:hypothetical protein KR067_010046 [Drosophila pandora]
MLTIHETMGMGIVGPASVCNLHMTPMQLAALTAAAFEGIVCSSYLWGYITDKMGRRWTLLRTISLSTVCSLSSMFMATFSGFFLMRFFTGIFVAGPSFVAVTYLSEFFPSRILGHVVTHMYMFNGFAMIYCPAMASLFLNANIMDFEVYILYSNLSLRPWRVLGCIFVLPGLLAFLLVLVMPESPKFLFMIGDREKGLKVMEWISQTNNKCSLTPDQIFELKQFQRYAQVKRQKSDKTIVRAMMTDAMPLFRKPHVRTVLAACVVMFILGLIANGVGIWYTAMRNRNHMRQGNLTDMSFCQILFDLDLGPVLETESDIKVICNDDFKGFNDSFIMGFLNLLLYNICWLSFYIAPRRAIFIIALLICATSGFILIFATNPWVQLLACILFLSIPGVIISLLGGALLENVPTFLRGRAMCICLMWARCGAVVGTTVTAYFFETYCEAFLLALALLPFSKIL